MYQLIIYTTIGFLVVALCAAIFIDWDRIGEKYFPEVFSKPEDK
jgi:hypothetical protein|tara:strand:- start:115 stop:246 length:132 start_codon:yes stop_codon:yes gene_type:complete